MLKHWEILFLAWTFCHFVHHSDLEEQEDAARVNKENDEIAAKNLQAEVSNL